MARNSRVPGAGEAIASSQSAPPSPTAAGCRAADRFSVTFQVGDRVVAESESTQRRARSGTVCEVLREDPAPRYRIDWDDGHSTVYTPAAGALHAERVPRQRDDVA